MARTSDPRMTKEGKVKRFKASYLEKGLQVGMDVILKIPREHPDFKRIPKSILEGKLFKETRFIRARVTSVRENRTVFQLLGLPNEVMDCRNDRERMLVIKCIAPHPEQEGN